MKFSFLSERVRFKPKMTSTGYSLYLQQGARKYEDSKKAKSLAKKRSLPKKKQKT